jgi:hypothetical protein
MHQPVFEAARLKKFRRQYFAELLAADQFDLEI